MPSPTGRALLRALTLVPLIVFAACSPGDDDTTSQPSATSPTTERATAAPDDTAGDAPQDTGEADDPAETPQTQESADEDRPVEITIAASGDILPHTWVNASARIYAGSDDRSMYPTDGDTYDYTPMFADVADLISAADLSLCHLETPLSPDSTNLSLPNTLSFNTPREMAEALAEAGFDGCDFASNHTMDRGIQGVADTEQVLREVGMGYAGPTAEEERAGQAEVYEVDTDAGTVQVAHLAYTYTYPNAGAPTDVIPGEAPWLVAASWPNLGSSGILEQARAARDAGAHFVVVSMHWGNEYQTEPTAEQREIAEDLLTSDAVDLILGTHVHVIQPCEQINDKHVIYGLGNFLSNQSPMTASSLLPQTQEGMLALVTLSRDEEGTVSSSMSYQPTRVEIPPEVAPGHIIRLVSAQTYPESWERTVAAVDLLGGCGAEPIDPGR